MANRLYYPTAYVRLFIRLEPWPKFDPDRLIELNFTPIRFSVERNSFKEADTAEITVDFEDFPLDARIIRGATVELFLADAGSVRDDFWEEQTHLDLIQNHCIFTGVVDRPETTIDDQWRKLKLKCRDYTAYFLDAAIKGPVKWTKEGEKVPFTQIIEDLVDQRFTTKQIEVVVDEEVDILLENDTNKSSMLYPANYKVGAGSNKRSWRREKEGESIWEVVQEISLEAGFITYFFLDKIYVRRPSTFFSGWKERDAYRMTLGDDISTYTIGRDLGRQSGINVKVISEDPDDGVVRIAFGPKDIRKAFKGKIEYGRILDTRKATTSTRKTGTIDEIEYMPVVVRGVFSQEHLQTIADELFELVRYHELDGSIETYNIEDTRGRNLIPLQYGDALIIDLAESFDSILTLDPEAQLEQLVLNDYDRTDAEEIKQALNLMDVPYYINEVSFRFDTAGETGLSILIGWVTRKQVDLDIKSAEIKSGEEEDF